MSESLKIEKRRLKEEREIVRLEKELLKPKGSGYMIYLFLIISVVYIADEVATQIGTQMQSVIAQALFAPVFGADIAVARMSALGSITMFAAAVAFLYKPLADRFGRKPFLVINTFGMGVGLLLISIAFNIPVYLLGSVFIMFFIPHDMQAVYILENAPVKHRAKLYSIIKAVATLGMMLIPALRELFMGADVSQWRLVYLAPAIMSLTVAVIAFLLIRETTPFIIQRLEYLKMSDNERIEAKKDKNAGNAQGGFISAIRFCMRQKQLRWLLIGNGFLTWGMSMTMYYEVTMTYGYAGSFLDAGMSIEQALVSAAPYVTQALFLFPLGSAIFQVFQGFLSDKLGRKPTVIIMCVFSVATFLLFFTGANGNWNPYLVGFLCGGAIGSFWAAGDITAHIMCSESTPTNLRASVAAVLPLLSGIFSAIAIFGAIALINVLGDSNAGLISISIAIPGMIISLIIIMLKVRETKGIKLEEIRSN